MSKPRKLAEWTKKSVAIWKATSAHRHAWVFRDPVDAEKLNLHDYHEVIKEPMDLGTVKSKLEAGSYDHPDQWEREMRLIFKNAKRYNPPGTDVHIMAEQVEEVFERKWAEAKQTVLQKYEEEQHMGAAAEAAPRAAAKTGKDKDRSSTKRLLESVNFSDDRAMSYEEKKQLSMDMNQLSSKKLGKIVEIIHYKHPKLLKQVRSHKLPCRPLTWTQNESDPEEIEIDIDQIDDATLRGLQDFVAKALASSSSKKKRRTANGE